jgi:hypothetical protein
MGFPENCASRPESMSGWISGVVGCADAGYWLIQPELRNEKRVALREGLWA